MVFQCKRASFLSPVSMVGHRVARLNSLGRRWRESNYVKLNSWIVVIGCSHWYIHWWSNHWRMRFPIERPTNQQPSLVVPHFGSCPLRQQLLVDPVSLGQRVLRRGDAWKLAGAAVVPWDLKMKFRGFNFNTDNLMERIVIVYCLNWLLDSHGAFFF